MRCTRCGKDETFVEFNHGLCSLCRLQVEELTKKQAEIYAETLRKNSPEEIEKRENSEIAFLSFIFVAVIWIISLPFQLIGWIIKKDKEQKSKELAKFEKENPTEFHKLHKNIKESYEYWKSKPAYEILPYSLHSEYMKHLFGLFMGGICFVGVWNFLHIRYSIPKETTLRFGIFLGILWYIVFFYHLVVIAKRHKTFVSWILYSEPVQKAADFIQTHTPDNNDFSNEEETKKNIFRLMEHRRAFPKENNQVSLVKYVFEQQNNLKLFKYTSANQYVNFSFHTAWLFILFGMAAFDLFFGGGIAVVIFLLIVTCKRKQYFKRLRQNNRKNEEELQKISTDASDIKQSITDTSSNPPKSTCHCSFCHELLEVEAEWNGFAAECPFCSKKFIIKVNE